MGILCRGLFGVIFVSLTMGSTAGFGDQPQKASSTRAITARINDLVLNRGSAGLWTYRNGRTLQRITRSAAASMAVGDFDGDGRHDILYGVAAPAPAAQRGTFTRIGSAAPNEIDPRGAVRMAVGDFDGDGQADVIATFDGVAGAHLRMNNGSFFQVHNSTPTSVAAGDLDGDGYDDVIIALPNGIFTCYGAQAPWIQLSTFPVQNIAVGDLNGDGNADLIVDRGPQGIWRRTNDSASVDAFTRIHTSNPLVIDLADPDGNDRDGVLAGLPNGLFFSTNGGASFTRINPNRPLGVTVLDFNNDGNEDIVTLLSGSNVQIRHNNAGPWRPFPGLSATGITGILAAGLD